MQAIQEYKVGRNFIRVRDRVKVVFPTKTQAKETRVVGIRADDDGQVVEVDVIDPRTKAKRTVTPDRVSRLEQTKAGERIASRV